MLEIDVLQFSYVLMGAFVAIGVKLMLTNKKEEY
ncbi:hypothetical protein BH23PAT2_BH23PAT2_05160 [soil metagenome]